MANEGEAGLPPAKKRDLMSLLLTHYLTLDRQLVQMPLGAVHWVVDAAHLEWQARDLVYDVVETII